MATFEKHFVIALAVSTTPALFRGISINCLRPLPGFATGQH